MSSARNNTLGSTVFQQTLVACGAFVLVSLALLWLICGWQIWRIDDQQAQAIEESIAYATDTYYGRGRDILIDEAITEDGNQIWSEDYIYEALEEQQQIWVLRSADYEAVAGYPGLHADLGWQTGWLDHPEVGQDVRSFRVELRGGDTLTVAEFFPDTRGNILSFGWFGTFALLCIVLPLSLVTGYVVSQRVFRRIESISATAAAVGRGEMTTRAVQSPRHDEFDRLAGSINQMLDQVQDLNSNIEAVTVGLAHDLRTPLTNIGGRMELIQRDATDPDAVLTHVEAAETAQAQLMRIFDALLRLGEVRAGRRKAAFETLNLSDLTVNLAAAFEPVFSEANKTFTTDIAPDLSISGDAELLEQMLANLLENALEHSRDAAQVAVALKATDLGPQLQISDDGPGISPLDRERVFDRFFRADSSRTTPGNGLGLSLVKAIAELHDAQVSLDPQAKGAVFVVQFPASG